MSSEIIRFSMKLTVVIFCIIISTKESVVEGDTTVANLALNQAATQSSTAWGGIATRAVDGNNDPYYGSLSCSHTDPAAGNHWWQVDLASPALVSQVKIQNKHSDAERLNNLDIHVGNTPDTMEQCAFFPGPGEADREYTFNCVKTLMGRYVKIQKRINDSPLSMCEVQVMGVAVDDVPLANLALNQLATQSSTAWGGLAARAVDGNNDPYFWHLSCSHTDPMADDHWWHVYLPSTALVHRVIIQNRDVYADRLANLNITVGYTPCEMDLCAYFEGPGEASSEYTLNCSQPMAGRHVKIQKTDPQTPLTLCEVKVIGVSADAL